MLFFHTVPSANTLVRWVNENAFAPIVRARPCPTFGRPVHLGVAPIDYGLVFLLMPFGSHLAVDTLPSKTCVLADEALPPSLDIAPLIRAPEGLQPS